MISVTAFGSAALAILSPLIGAAALFLARLMGREPAGKAGAGEGRLGRILVLAGVLAVLASICVSFYRQAQTTGLTDTWSQMTGGDPLLFFVFVPMLLYVLCRAFLSCGVVSFICLNTILAALSLYTCWEVLYRKAAVSRKRLLFLAVLLGYCVFLCLTFLPDMLRLL